MEEYITGIGVVASLLVSMISLYISGKCSRNSKYVDTIVKEKLEHREKVRKVIAEYTKQCAINKVLFITEKSDDKKEHFMRCVELHNRILIKVTGKYEIENSIISICDKLLLNIKNYYLLDGVEYNVDYVALECDSERHIKDLIEKTRVYLDIEWNFAEDLVKTGKIVH